MTLALCCISGTVPLVFHGVQPNVAEVIRLNTKKPIPPKSETFEHAGQRYRCTYDPNAPAGEKWVWTVYYVPTFKFYGSSPTMEAAAKAARLKIHKLVKEDDSG